MGLYRSTVAAYSWMRGRPMETVGGGMIETVELPVMSACNHRFANYLERRSVRSGTLPFG